MNSKFNFKLINEFSLMNFGGSELFINDINSDGKIEFLWLQALGTLSSDAYYRNPRYNFLNKFDKNLFCLTATDLNGNIIWQHGLPYNGNIPFPSHAAESLVDFSGKSRSNNKVEVICKIKSDQIAILNGKMGNVLKKHSLPADNFAVIRTSNRLEDDSYTILVKNSVEAYPPYYYGNPILFYDNNFKLLKEWNLKGAGHFPAIFDVDNDGFDEFIIGYNLLDHNLELVWTVDYWRTRQINPFKQHADFIEVFYEKNQFHIVVAGSDALYFIDSNGILKWKLDLPHPQYCKIGKFIPQIERTIFVTNCATNPAYFITLDGKILWSKKLPEHCPNGKPKCVAPRSMHLDIPFSVWRSHESSYCDFIIYHEQGWPYIICGNGKIEYSISCPQNAVQKPVNFPGFYPDRYGFGYRTRTYDIDNDGVQEIIVFDRKHAWIYKVEL